MSSIVAINGENEVILFMPYSPGYRPFPHAENIQAIECLMLQEEKENAPEHPIEWQNIIKGSS